MTNFDFPVPPLFEPTRDMNTQVIAEYFSTIADFFYNYAPITIQTDTLTALADTTGGVSWPDTASTTVSYFLQLPFNYVSSAITLRLYRRGAATGTAVMTWTAFRLRDATARLTVVAVTAITFVASDTNTHLTTLTIPATDLAPGDMLRIDIVRDGADGADTLAGNVVRDGLTASYYTRVQLVQR